MQDDSCQRRRSWCAHFHPGIEAFLPQDSWQSRHCPSLRISSIRGVNRNFSIRHGVFTHESRILAVKHLWNYNEKAVLRWPHVKRSHDFCSHDWHYFLRHGAHNARYLRWPHEPYYCPRSDLLVVHDLQLRAWLHMEPLDTWLWCYVHVWPYPWISDGR